LGNPIVYLDESGFAVDMPRTHGYAQIGKRCYGSSDWHARGRVNVIGASINMELISVGLFDSYIDSDIFYQWTIRFLLPALKQSSVIVLDNAAFHKRHDIQRAILDAGHILIYLPPYSPDLNPIEHKWAQAKSIRRKLRCDVDTLFAKHIS
jgi:transposase